MAEGRENGENSENVPAEKRVATSSGGSRTNVQAHVLTAHVRKDKIIVSWEDGLPSTASTSSGLDCLIRVSNITMCLLCNGETSVPEQTRVLVTLTQGSPKKYALL